MLQAWQLYKADALAVAGAPADGIASARRAFDFSKLGPIADHYIGTYCRWCGFVATPRERSSARDYLSGVLEHLDAYDALDQAEILLGARLVTDGISVTLERELQRRLSALPAGVGEFFKRVGMIR
jgi:hypothetical protein